MWRFWYLKDRLFRFHNCAFFYECCGLDHVLPCSFHISWLPRWWRGIRTTGDLWTLSRGGGSTCSARQDLAASCAITFATSFRSNYEGSMQMLWCLVQEMCSRARITQINRFQHEPAGSTTRIAVHLSWLSYKKWLWSWYLRNTDITYGGQCR